MDSRGWQLKIFDNGQLLDLSKENACSFDLNKPKTLELRYLGYEDVTPEIQVNVCEGTLDFELQGRFLTVTPKTSCCGLLSFFVPHNEDESKIDTIEFLSFNINGQ